MRLVHATVETFDPYLIGNLPEGHVGYVTPWSFVASRDGKLYITGTARWRHQIVGTASFKVTRMQGKVVVDQVPADGFCCVKQINSKTDPTTEPVYVVEALRP
jgi:hypothetical protein